MCRPDDQLFRRRFGRVQRRRLIPAGGRRNGEVLSRTVRLLSAGLGPPRVCRDRTQMLDRAPRPYRRPADGRAQHTRGRGARQQGGTNEQQHGDDEVHTDALHRAVRCLIQRLADDPSVGLHEHARPRGFARVWARTRANPERSCRQRHRHSRSQTRRARPQRAHLRPCRPRQQRAAACDQRDRGKHLRFADAPAERLRQRTTDASPVPAAVQDEPEEHTQRDRREPDHVALALVELGVRGGHTRASNALGANAGLLRRRLRARVRAFPAFFAVVLRGAVERLLVAAISRNFDIARADPFWTTRLHAVYHRPPPKAVVSPGATLTIALARPAT